MIKGPSEDRICSFFPLFIGAVRPGGVPLPARLLSCCSAAPVSNLNSQNAYKRAAEIEPTLLVGTAFEFDASHDNTLIQLKKVGYFRQMRRICGLVAIKIQSASVLSLAVDVEKATYGPMPAFGRPCKTISKEINWYH